MSTEHKKGWLGKKFAKAAGIIILSASLAAMLQPHISSMFNKNSQPANPENKIEKVEKVEQQKAPEVLKQKQSYNVEALELYRDFLGVLIEASHEKDIGISEEAMDDIENLHDKMSKLDLKDLTAKQLEAINTITDSFNSTSYYGKIPMPETLLVEKDAKLAEKKANLGGNSGASKRHIEYSETSYTTVEDKITSYQNDTASGDIDGNGNVTNIKKSSTSIPSLKK